MRHLRVPSVDTQHWLNLCKSNGWLFLGVSVTSLSDGMKGLPINDSAPKEDDEIWLGHKHIQVEREISKAKHWTDLLDSNLYFQYEEYWPRSYEMIGDVLIVRLEEEVSKYKKEVAEAMLERIKSARVICADNGVTGEFRVRELEPIQSRNKDQSTLTKIKENGQYIAIDPAKAYFSSRLSTEREGNIIAAKQLSEKLQRPITISDPYAGVGPALAGMLSQPNLVQEINAGDLNPDAFKLLKFNLNEFLSRNKKPSPQINIRCSDARDWKNEGQFIQSTDLLLVNLPHDTISHLNGLIPLMRRNQLTLIRGWAIISRNELQSTEQTIKMTIEKNGGSEIKLTCSEIKGFSSTKIFIRIESWQKFL